jgi:hypothetical protein
LIFDIEEVSETNALITHAALNAKLRLRYVNYVWHHRTAWLQGMESHGVADEHRVAFIQ